MDPLRHVKPAVRSLAAYTLALREAPVKINQNENPWDLPEAVKRRVLEKALARPWSRYPDFDPKELLEALARFSGWRADGILAGNGSNEAIEALLLVTVGPGTKVVIPEPTFTLYALMTTILGGDPVRVPMVREPQAGDATGDPAGGVTGASACAAALISERSVHPARPPAVASGFATTSTPSSRLVGRAERRSRSCARPTTPPARASRPRTSSGCAGTATPSS